MPKLEKDIMKEVRQILSQYECTGEVEWWERLNSGKVRVGYNYISMCRKGTPDFVVLVRGWNTNIKVVFVECKSDKGILRKEQVAFCNNVNTKKDFWYLTIRDSKELRAFISSISYDFTQDLPEDI